MLELMILPYSALLCNCSTFHGFLCLQLSCCYLMSEYCASLASFPMFQCTARANLLTGFYLVTHCWRGHVIYFAIARSLVRNTWTCEVKARAEPEVYSTIKGIALVSLTNYIGDNSLFSLEQSLVNLDRSMSLKI